MNNILIIVPAYNEQESIGKTLEQIRSISMPCDIVVVNDGSNDNTEQIVTHAKAKLLSHPINLGAGAAIQTGLKYTLDKKYDIAVVVDGDGQHDPEEIPKLIDALKKRSMDVVIGSRFGGQAAYKTSFARSVGIKLFSIITFILTKEKIADITSGFRAYNQRAINFLASEYPEDFPDAEIIILLALSGFKLCEIPVNIRPRLAGRSMYTFLRSIYYPFKVAIGIFAILLRIIFIKKEKIK